MKPKICCPDRRNGPFVWIGQRCSDALPLVALGRISSILSCDYGQTGAWLESDLGIPVVSLEKASGIRSKWSFSSIEDLARHLMHSSQYHSLLAAQSNALWLPYTNSPGLEKLADSIGVGLLGASSRLRAEVENKLQFRRMLQNLALPSLPTLYFENAEALSYKKVEGSFGVPFVVQTGFGSSGSGTAIVRDETTFNVIVRTFRKTTAGLLATPYVKGYSLNQHLVVYRDGAVPLAPSVQLVGIPDCTTHELGYCGNDFAAVGQLDPTLLKECFSQCEIIGVELSRIGFYGLCGIDFIITPDDRVFAIELNARFQNSTPLLCYALQEHGPSLPIVEHVRACRMLTKPLTEFEKYSVMPCSQVIVNNLRAASKASGCVHEGVYQAKGSSEFVCVDVGHQLVRQQGAGYLVASSLPQQGLLVQPGAALTRIQTTRTCLEGDRITLEPGFSAAARWAQRSIIGDKVAAAS